MGQDAVVFQRRRVAHRLAAGGNVAEQPPHDLAASRLGQRVGEVDVVGHGQSADLLADVLLQGLAEVAELTIANRILKETAEGSY